MANSANSLKAYGSLKVEGASKITIMQVGRWFSKKSVLVQPNIAGEDLKPVWLKEGDVLKLNLDVVVDVP